MVERANGTGTDMGAHAIGEETILLVGSPNVGKSTIFGVLTGRYVTVSNYPGTTVEVSRGRASYHGREYTVVDTPGADSLTPTNEAEQVTRDMLLACPGARVVQVAEMKNIRRALLLAVQLAELQVRCVLDLNMSDEASSDGLFVDAQKLAALLGVEVVETVAVQRKGIGQLTKRISDPRLPTVQCPYPADVEAAVERIEALLPQDQPGTRGIALMFLAGDETIVAWARSKLDESTLAAIEDIRRRTATGSHQSLGYRINLSRLAFVDRLLAGVLRSVRRPPLKILDVVGRYSMHPVWGIPVLAAVLLAAYYVVGIFGAGTLVDLMESRLFGAESASVGFELGALPAAAASSFSSMEEGGAPSPNALPGDVILEGTWRQTQDGLSIDLSAIDREGVDATGAVTIYWYLSGDRSSAYGRFTPRRQGGRSTRTATIPGALLEATESNSRVAIRAWSGLLNRHVFNLTHAYVPTRFIRDLLVGEHGIVTMGLTYAIAIVLPIVGVFFIFFSCLEDSGYLPRLAIMVNVFFKRLGLNGKAVLPMVLGLGCDTMATMTTRIMETRKERIIVTLLLALAVPCSAQLGVILGMLSALSFSASAIWLGAVVGVIFLVGHLAAKLLPGQGSDFILEVPPLRVPRLGNIFIKTVGRIEWYVKEAVPLFVLGTLVLFALDRLALLEVLQRGAAPLVEGALGLPREATSAFLVGFLRRDYGAAGLYTLFQPQIAAGRLSLVTEIQIVVSMITITLFVPCIANVFMMIKERGLGPAMAMVAFIFPFAFGVGALVNFGMRAAYGLL
jgi:ferrous iron transport protein B